VTLIVLRPQAIEDLRAAKRHYEEQRAGLGDELRDALDIVFERLRAFPRSAPSVAGFPGVPARARQAVPIRRFLCRNLGRNCRPARAAHCSRSRRMAIGSRIRGNGLAVITAAAGNPAHP
jgi:hypothetical protein